jgi:hypothetical protein
MRDCPDIASSGTAELATRRSPSFVVAAVSLSLLVAALAAPAFVVPADAIGREASSTLHRGAVVAPLVHQIRAVGRAFDVASDSLFSPLRMILTSLVIGLVVLTPDRARRWRYGAIGRRAPPVLPAV